MLFIRQVKHLAGRLGVDVESLESIAERSVDFCEELVLNDPKRPNRPRDVLNATGKLRELQLRLYERVLLPKINFSQHSHGGVPGRSIKTNIEPHLKSRFVLTADISNFYPSISYRRVYGLFAERLGCSPDVARLCTKLCTYKHHLALGLITSPILADQIAHDVDVRLGAACSTQGLIYTRFVDDIAISGPFSFQRCGIRNLVVRILKEHGFRANAAKHRHGRAIDSIVITGLRFPKGHPDVQQD